VATTAIHAKQLTITPVRGSVWFVDVDELGYLLIQSDSLIVYNNEGQPLSQNALKDTRRVSVEDTPAFLPSSYAAPTSHHSFDIIGRPTQPDHQGIYIVSEDHAMKKVLKK